MSETIVLGDVSIAVSRKSIKNVHLSVHPPQGRVTLVAPTATRFEVVRAFYAYWACPAILRIPVVVQQLVCGESPVVGADTGNRLIR